MHWCADETMALVFILSSIPFVGPWIKARLQKLTKPHCCYKDHNHEKSNCAGDSPGK